MSAELITALVSLLTILGGGIAFVWRKIELRFVQNEAEMKHIQQELDACKNRDATNQSRMAELIFAIRIMADDMHQSNPHNPLLKSVQRILEKAYPLYPTEMTDLLDRIDRAPFYAPKENP